ncbi:hypothetical protein Cgig2_014564 [Carnegiea gigantea]|uniref:F-box domain-containing protein n=1 Tax=Carnegiea gigantea TaxID=171969 RepID=A0A9Q1KXT7_9CARY|nr:hypothetical protein Cgig2_014564 [Carnegiea gigantea]
MSNSTLCTLQCKEHNQGQDCISKLPDEIIVSILSFMDLKGSARTSVLSRTWRYLWTNVADLNFDASNMMFKNPHLFDQIFAKDKFSRNVNQVVSLHRKGISINKFRVCFLLDKDHASHIDEWVKFALSKRVKTLELDFFWVKFALSKRVKHPKLHFFCDISNYYPLGRHELVEHLTYEDGMRSLTTLHLSCVHVIGDVLEFILSRCSLERLSISFSYGLERLSIKKPSLKYLKIQWCFGLNELELDARELVYPGDLALNFAGFPNLKYLELKVFAEQYNHDTLVACMCLAQGCPSLLELKLKVTWERLKVEWKFNDHELGIEADTESKGPETRIATYTCSDEAKCIDHYDEEDDEEEEGGMNFEMKLNHWAKEAKRSPKSTLPNLISFEFVGFTGNDTDVKLVMHIVEAAPNLRAICLNSTPLYSVCCNHRREASKKLARKLAMAAHIAYNYVPVVVLSRFYRDLFPKPELASPFLAIQVTCEQLDLDLEFNEYELGSEDDEDIASEESTAGTWCDCLDIANIDNNKGVCSEMKLVHWARQVKHGPNTVPNLSSFELVGFVGIEHDVSHDDGHPTDIWKEPAT